MCHHLFKVLGMAGGPPSCIKCKIFAYEIIDFPKSHEQFPNCKTINDVVKLSYNKKIKKIFEV